MPAHDVPGGLVRWGQKRLRTLGSLQTPVDSPLYDIAVIGAGPAGATVARIASERGLHVLLVDKKQELGAPVQCSGAVSASALHDAGVAPHDEFVRAPVYGFVVYDAAGQETRLDYRAMQPADHAAEAIGYVVDRRRFDRHLVMLAERAGVEVWLKTEGTGFEALGDGTVALGLNRLGRVTHVRARMIVGADGLQSQVGKWAGLRTHIRLPDLASCLQVVVDGVETDGLLEIVTGRPWAPGGYAWLVPNGHGYAEVGLGAIRTRTEHDARWHLDRFMQHSFLAERLRDARVLEVQGGGVPLAAPLKQPYADHVILVGDAARHVNPITGGGIHTALRGGSVRGARCRPDAGGRSFRRPSHRRPLPMPTPADSADGPAHTDGLRYRRVLLKLSGEALLGDKEFGIDHAVLSQYARDVREAVQAGVQVALVIGGGNIFRGVSPQGTRMSSRAHADYMGMLATMINAMALQDALEAEGLHTRLVSAIDMNEIAEPFIRRRAIRHLEKGRVVLFGAGTGHPYFSTDTAASLRAAEVDAEVILKGTRVDGVFTADPERDPEARRFETIHGSEVLARDLGVMDLTAITLAKQSGLPILVFNMNTPGTFARVLRGEPLGTTVHWDADAEPTVFARRAIADAAVDAEAL